MKLEDEIQVIFKGLECGELYYIDSRRKSNASKEIKSLIERYCKRQRLLCARPFPCTQDPSTILTILEAKLATEE